MAGAKTADSKRKASGDPSTGASMVEPQQRRIESARLVDLTGNENTYQAIQSMVEEPAQARPSNDNGVRTASRKPGFDAKIGQAAFALLMAKLDIVRAEVQSIALATDDAQEEIDVQGAQRELDSTVLHKLYEIVPELQDTLGKVCSDNSKTHASTIKTEKTVRRLASQSEDNGQNIRDARREVAALDRKTDDKFQALDSSMARELRRLFDAIDNIGTQMRQNTQEMMAAIAQASRESHQHSIWLAAQFDASVQSMVRQMANLVPALPPGAAFYYDRAQPPHPGPR